MFSNLWMGIFPISIINFWNNVCVMYELASWHIWQCIPKKVKIYYRIWKSERNFVQKSLWYFPWPISSVVPNSPTISMQQHQGKRAKRHAALNAHNTTVARRNRATVSAVRAPPLRKVARYWRELSCRCSAVHCAMRAAPRWLRCTVWAIWLGCMLLSTSQLRWWRLPCEFD